MSEKEGVISSTSVQSPAERRGHPYKRLWISFESGEGAGKDTQINLLYANLQERGYDVELGREPGKTMFGEIMRRALQDPNVKKLHPKTEMLGYIAAGVEFYNEEVKPVLERGGIYLANRWRDSTRAYQGFGLGLDLKVIDVLTDFSCDGSMPDFTVLLDVPAEVGLGKISGHEFGEYRHDKIEARPLSYHEKVNEGYRELARRNPERFRVVPYVEGDIKGMQQSIIREFDEYIVRHNLQDTLARKT